MSASPSSGSHDSIGPKPAFRLCRAGRCLASASSRSGSNCAKVHAHLQACTWLCCGLARVRVHDRARRALNAACERAHAYLAQMAYMCAHGCTLQLEVGAPF